MLGSVRVYGQSASWHAVRQNVLSDLQSIGSGAAYQYQAWIRAASGTSSARLRLRTISGGITLNNDVVVTVNSAGWTLVSTNKIISWSGTLTEAWLEIANDTATAEYYVDDCSVSSSGGNSAPVFTRDSFSKSNANAGAFYSNVITSGTVSDDVYDPDGDAITFMKTSGSAWLSVSTNGVLSGTPGTGDAGPNQFTIQASDTRGGTATAQLQITVTYRPVV